MFSIYPWLLQKSDFFSEKIFLIDKSQQISYSENFKKICALMARLKNLNPEDNIVFLGSGSIASYQLYFAVIALQAIWIPLSFRLEPETLNLLINKIKPTLIIYSEEANDLIKKISFPSIHQSLLSLTDNLSTLRIPIVQGNKNNRIISMYLTSGSTGAPKLVQHSWHATLHHANATVERYGFNASSRLFNPRQLFHVSGAFALTTMMHCGGSILIPPTDYYKKSEQEYLHEWAFLMQEKQVTHASFFPTEMRSYAALLDKNPDLVPKTLQRITTGGEAVEFSDLVNVSRAFAMNRRCFDYLWKLYPYLGDGSLFEILKIFYEKVYGSMVQVTQTYGATELICNAIANSPLTGPDTRGVGSAINTIHPEIVDEDNFALPHDGKEIGCLQFYGSSIASGYLDNDETVLSPHCYKTNDLASIDPLGRVRFFGRSENLICLPNVAHKINPMILENKLNQIEHVKSTIVLKLENKLHAAILAEDVVNKPRLINTLGNDPDFSFIETISLWYKFPLTLGGKVDRKSVTDSVVKGGIAILTIGQLKQEISENTNRTACVII